MAQIEIRLSPLAKEKLKEIINGSKEKVMDLFNNIDKYIKEKSYDLLFKGDTTNFYYKKCNNIYAIFTIRDESTIGIVDFITEIEFEKFKKKGI